MRYNSVHRFADIEDARLFVSAIKNAGFSYTGCEKDGGVIYSNGKHEMMVYVQQ